MVAAVAKEGIDLGVEFAEEMGIKQGLLLAMKRGIRRLLVESGCALVIKAIKDAREDHTYLGCRVLH